MLLLSRSAALELECVKVETWWWWCGIKETMAWELSCSAAVWLVCSMLQQRPRCHMQKNIMLVKE